MGLLDDYQIDLNEVEEPNYDIDDDFYEFVVSDMFIKEGTKKDPNAVNLVIDYSLGDSGKSKQEWFGLPEDASSPTTKEIQKLGFLKLRLKSLGASDEQLQSIDPDDFIGLSGTLEVFTNKGYQNIRNVRLDEDASDAETEVEEAPKAAPAKAPAAKKVAPKVAERKAEAAPAKAASVGVKRNPFAK